METAVMDAIEKFIAADILNVCEVCVKFVFLAQTMLFMVPPNKNP
jgi:hypothetical protein